MVRHASIEELRHDVPPPPTHIYLRETDMAECSIASIRAASRAPCFDPSEHSSYSERLNLLPLTTSFTTSKMSDTGRQSFTDKAQSSMKVRRHCPRLADKSYPLTRRSTSLQSGSQKSTTEQVGDTARSAFDSAASSMQPQVSLRFTLFWRL